MRTVRHQLINLLKETRLQHQLEIPPLRLQAALVHNALHLLSSLHLNQTKHQTDLISQTLSHAAMHRHLILIRCPDQAFYLDAVKGYLLRHDIQPIGQQTMVAMLLNKHGNLELLPPDQKSDNNFMFIALHLSATLVNHCQQVTKDIRAVLQSVELSVKDFSPITEQINQFSQHVQTHNPEDSQLLQWMNDGRYLLFGMQVFSDHGTSKRFGLLRNLRVLEHIIPNLHSDIEALPAPEKEGLTWLHLSSSHHHLYSTARIEVLQISWENPKGKYEHAIIVGHFSRSARHSNASQTPGIQQHWQQLNQANLLKHSAFYRREIRTLFDRIPKSILISIAPKYWLQPLQQVVDLTVPTHMVISRLTPAQGDVEYLFMALHNKRFGPNVMRKIDSEVKKLGLDLHGHDSFGVGPYRIIIAAVQAHNHWPAMHKLQKNIQSCIIFWKDRARYTILKQAKRIDIPLALRELEQLPALYQELFPPEQFLTHFQIRETTLKQHRTLVQSSTASDGIELQVLSCKPIPLGQLIDKIQAFGLTAMQEAAVDFGTDKRTIHISCIHCNTPHNFHPEAHQRLAYALENILNNQADHDALNYLLLSAGLGIDQVAVLITLRNHLIQLIPDAAPTPLSQMLNAHPKAAAALYHMFEARHRIGIPFTALAKAQMDFNQAMNEVSSLTDDRWLHALEQLIQSSLRSNAYQRETGEVLAIKIDPSQLDFAPQPQPYREIFVHGTHVEGVHLRGGPVSRGGIRYSDRPADFRTEVLELMSTQIVKNGQIVPTGAKGGFVIRGASISPEFILQQYKQFIRALLLITDNLIHGECIAPDGIRIAPEDNQDPYLVVAADKGTARFSDDANDEARLCCFWLDDAFASGGKYGYDHKVFGITARGAWTCAAHHFKLLGKDAYQDDISCIAIGDMAGDVFGNGMLINPNLQLLGAFNHQHIFLDPNPDSTAAFKERQRLFKQVKGWGDYNIELISEGGGVFKRSAKRIDLSKSIRQRLHIQNHYLSGEALIQALLSAPIDLLYNGGIGTYVKASSESHSAVKDPANNQVRIDATQLQCVVVCEGGNLGFTQLARIEYASCGGHINTDAIDNAAGVNMSDREVNLKILFTATAASHIGNQKRDKLLQRISADVSQQCLYDNQLQAEALTLAQIDMQEHPARILRLRDTLLQQGRLDRRIDPGLNNPDNIKLLPQLAVFLGHEKNRIHESLDQEDFQAWSNFTQPILERYFPAAVYKQFQSEIHQHPLKSAISHTQVANLLINNIGIASVHHLQSLLDTPVAHICEALLTALLLLDMKNLSQGIQNTPINTQELYQMRHTMQEYTMHVAEELLRLFDMQKIDVNWLKKQQQGMCRFRKSLAARGIGGDESSRFLSLLKPARQVGLSIEQASHLAALPELSQMATACFLSQDLSQPLSRCLHAMQATLHLLPFNALEMPMRSAEWASEDAHPLRCEWLNRITLLKARAGQQLLKTSSSNFIKKGESYWSSHRNWNLIQQFSMRANQQGEENGASDEQRRMQLMLALTQLESIIEGS
ncbi:MAG: NAD-glutamate dehydrogenase [Mariprofundaceae bacterium]